jgi:hypothetical protein
MSGQQKRGFRLPWAAERGDDEASVAATLDPELLDSAPAAENDDPADGHVDRAAGQPAMSRDAAPAASEVPDASAEAEMIDADSLQDHIDRASSDGQWPTSDRATPPDAEARDAAESADTADADTPPATGETAPEATRAPTSSAGGAPKAAGGGPQSRSGKRENPIVAGLVKAMREAAVASRSETTTRLQAEASARIEAIRAESTEEAAALRKRVDDDIAGIREWSKVEMARIKAETEHRIEERRGDAINESQRHLDAVEKLVEQVQATVSAFEADMDRFFKRLLAENDPAALAALAEQAPDAPDLTGELSKPGGWTTRAGDGSDEADRDDEAPASGQPLEAHAAAAAEAAASEGLDLSTAEEWPAAVMEAARRADTTEAADAAATDSAAASRLLVDGLTSVADISAFKGAVGGLPGVRSVSVSTGERGVFVYTVNHDQETDLATELTALSGFAVDVTASSDDGLTVTAHERAE